LIEGSKQQQGIMESQGVIEVDLFSPEVNSPEHPEAGRFKKLLEEVAEEHHCRLTSFDIDNGTVLFSFDSDELTAKILAVLQDERENQT